MTKIDEIAPDLFRLSIHVPELNMQFNHFLVRDDAPLLYHAGFRKMFPLLKEAVATLLDPSSLRHIAWSHFESDECGALNDWLELAPRSQPVCTLVGKLVNADDFAIRPAFGMTAEDVLETGKYRFRIHRSPHLPHGWDAGMMFEENSKTLFCSDLFHHFGDPAAIVSDDIVGPSGEAMKMLSQGPLAGYMPYTRRTAAVLEDLAELNPETLAVMHGSSFTGNGNELLLNLAEVVRENFEG